MPPSAHGVKVISIGMFTPGNTPVVWRGPMLHRALQQFLADVCWGDLDVLLLDLPPGHRRHRDLGGPAAAERRAARGDHAAAGRRRGGRAGRRDRARRPTSGSPASSRTCRGWPARTAVSRWRCSAPAAARRSRDGADPRSAPRCRCSARCRSTPGCARAATTGTPLVLADPDVPRRAAAAPRSPRPGQHGPRPGRALPEPQPASARAGGGGTLRSPPCRRAGSRAVRGAWRRTVAVGGAGGGGQRCSSSRLVEQRLLLHLAEQVLLHEGLRVQVFDLEFCELRAETLAQVLLGALGDFRSSRSALPALAAIFGSSLGPKTTSAITASSRILGRDRSNTGASPSAAHERDVLVPRSTQTVPGPDGHRQTGQ